MFRIGIDLGGTKIEGHWSGCSREGDFPQARGDAAGKGLRPHPGPHQGVHDELAAGIHGAPHTFGIGTPGAISPRTGLLKNSNTVCMNAQPLKADLERILGRKIEIQNDANCFAMAEALFGAGKGRRLVFGVIMGTGCGGRNRPQRRGCHRSTGHRRRMGPHVHRPGRPVVLLRPARMRGDVHQRRRMEARYAEQFGKKRPFKEIVNDYSRGDAKAVEFMKVFFLNFGRSLANLIDVLDPDVVVLAAAFQISMRYTRKASRQWRNMFSAIASKRPSSSISLAIPPASSAPP